MKASANRNLGIQPILSSLLKQASNTRGLSIFTRTYALLGSASAANSKDITQLEIISENLLFCKNSTEKKITIGTDNDDLAYSLLRQKVNDRLEEFIEKTRGYFSMFTKDRCSQLEEYNVKLKILSARRGFSSYYRVFSKLSRTDILIDILEEELFELILKLSKSEDFNSVIKIVGRVTDTFSNILRGQLLDTFRDSIIPNILEKFIFQERAYFPMNKVAIFSENYQKAYDLIDLVYTNRGIELPEVVRTNIRKKQTIIYQSYVITVIKNIEKLLFLANKHKDMQTKEEIETFLGKKYGEGKLSKLLEKIFEDNFKSRMVTKSLLGKILSLNIHILARIGEFIKDQSIYNSTLGEYYCGQLGFFCISLKETITEKINNLFSQIDLEEQSLSSRIITSLQTRLDSTLEILAHSLISRVVKTLPFSIEADLANIALKLKIQSSNSLPNTSSILIPKLRSSYQQFRTLLESNGHIFGDPDDFAQVLSRHLSSVLAFLYADLPQSPAINRQMELDISSLNFDA